jgi:hypothetical protein
MGLFHWITNTTDEESDKKDTTFQITWALLHLLALVNCIAVILHILSVTYHTKRVGGRSDGTDTTRTTN